MKVDLIEMANVCFNALFGHPSGLSMESTLHKDD